MANARVSRGRKTQLLVAEYLAEHGWPSARSRPASLPGADIEETPGVDFEVKGTADGPLLAGLRQARTRSPGALHVVVWRPNGYGPERIGEWVLAMPLDEGVDLIRSAGYGTPTRYEGIEA